jgi:hypothetical protein
VNNHAETKSKLPTHTIYFLRNKEGVEKPEWIKAGVAWEHGDGEGMNLSILNLDREVSLTVRKNKPKPE